MSPLLQTCRIEGERQRCSPRFLFTYPAENDGFDITLGIQSNILSDDNEWEYTMGFTLGAGISTDLSKWAIRPEVGYTFDPGESGHLWHFGLGVVYTLNEVW